MKPRLELIADTPTGGTGRPLNGRRDASSRRLTRESAAFVPDFDIAFQDFSPEADTDIKGTIELRLLGSCLRAKNDPQSVARVLDIFRLLHALGDDACSLEWVATIYRYMAATMDIEAEVLQDIAQKTLSTSKREPMPSNCPAPSVPLQRASAAIASLFVGDSLTMPVHWFCNTADIERAFPGGIKDLEAAPDFHPSSIMSLHSTVEDFFSGADTWAERISLWRAHFLFPTSLFLSSSFHGRTPRKLPESRSGPGRHSSHGRQTKSGLRIDRECPDGATIPGAAHTACPGGSSCMAGGRRFPVARCLRSLIMSW